MSKKEYDIEYIRTNCKQIKLLLNKEKDADIISYLEKQTNVNGHLKSLIREQIKKGGE